MTERATIGGSLPPVNGRELLAPLFGGAALPSGANQGLVFDRYLQVWHGDKKLITDKKPALQRFVDGFLRTGQGEAAELLKDVHHRLDQIQPAPHRLQFKTVWNLTIGLGGAHPMGNGFTLDPVIGVPYLPGSAIKGLCRAWAESCGMGDEAINRLFGYRDGSGDVIFLPAYPTIWPALVVDIVNCHHQEYYGSASKRPAVDYEAPVPVYILAIAPGTSFDFRVVSRVGSEENLRQTTKLFTEAVGLIGIGAKTAVGYGVMELLPSEIPPRGRRPVRRQESPASSVGNDSAWASSTAIGSSDRRDVDNRLLELEQALPLALGKALVRALREAECPSIRPIDPTTSHCFLLRAGLAPHLREPYGLAEEIMILISPNEVASEDLRQAREEMYRAGLSLDPDLIVIVDTRPDLADRIQPFASGGQQWIPWPAELGPDGYFFPPLRKQLQQHLPRYDLFQQTNPVRGRQVLGRKEHIAALSRRVENGQSVGVFGLRKIGKTSLVRAVTDLLDPQSARPVFSSRAWKGTPRVRVIWLDCELVVDRSREGLPMKLLERLDAHIELEPSADPLVKLDRTLTQLTRTSQPPLCIVLDEYNLLFEGDGGKLAPLPELERVLGLLRAHAQETGRLSLIVIGRDPIHFQQPRLNGVPNPMLSWFTPQWVGPLERDNANGLLGTLGKRVGLRVGHRTEELALHWTGGHPLLHRQYGSELLGVARTKGINGAHIDTDPFCEEAIAPFQENEEVTALCRDVFDLLSGSAADLLSELARSSEDASTVLSRYDGWSSASCVELRHFGVLTGLAEAPVLPEILRWYARRNRFL